VGIGRTFEPTRSGTGSHPIGQQAHASGQVLPLIRTLLQSLHHGSQARLRTFPGMLGDRGDDLFGFKVSQQEGGIEVALHRPTSTRAGMKSLRERLFDILPAPMAILREFGFESRDFDQEAASFCNYAGQMRYKHPWGAKSNALAILFLPSFKRGLFDVDRLSHRHDIMRQPAM